MIDGRALALKREEKLKDKIQFLYGRTKSVVKVVSILVGDDRMQLTHFLGNLSCSRISFFET